MGLLLLTIKLNYNDLISVIIFTIDPEKQPINRQN